LSGQEKLSIPYIEGIAMNLICPLENLIKHGIDFHPTILAVAPIFCDHMIGEEVWMKVGCEAVAHAGRNAVCSKHSTEHAGEITAVPYQSLAGRALMVYWCREQRLKSIQFGSNITQLEVLPATSLQMDSVLPSLYRV
jgi:hypothetical protein